MTFPFQELSSQSRHTSLLSGTCSSKCFKGPPHSLQIVISQRSTEEKHSLFCFNSMIEIFSDVGATSKAITGEEFYISTPLSLSISRAPLILTMTRRLSILPSRQPSTNHPSISIPRQSQNFKDKNVSSSRR